MMKDQILRAASLAAALAAVLMAGSCATSVSPGLTADPDVNHPITVAPVYRSMKLSFGTPAAGLTPADEARFEHFVDAYLKQGNGSVSVSVPKGPGSSAAIRYFGERLVAMGVPRSSIMVGTRTIADGDARIKLGFIGYKASTAPCGGWSDASSTYTNQPMSNFGCANQHNLAAMIRDPRDLVAPRGLGPSDATRRSTVMGKYETGKPTAAQKNADQTTKITTEASQ